MHSIGPDLTDPYAACPRDVDVAVVDEGGRCHFAALPAFTQGTDVGEWLSSLTSGPASGDVLVIDGPLGLAAAGETMRLCERALGAPRKIPDVAPSPGFKPFAGFVRGSVELADALARTGWFPASSTATLATATMLEAYPGGTWKQLAGRRLPRNTTKDGLRSRAELLDANGLSFARASQTHDELDAALCAWLGWALRSHPHRVTAIGAHCIPSSGDMREGVILQSVGTGIRPPRT